MDDVENAMAELMHRTWAISGGRQVHPISRVVAVAPISDLMDVYGKKLRSKQLPHSTTVHSGHQSQTASDGLLNAALSKPETDEDAGYEAIQMLLG